MAKTKEVVREKIEFSYNDYNFGRYSEFTLSGLQEKAEAFAKQNNGNIDDISFIFYSDDDDYYGPESYLTFKGWRWETDEEFETRKAKILAKREKDRENALKSRKAQKKIQDEKDRAEYERLKKKFEKEE